MQHAPQANPDAARMTGFGLGLRPQHYPAFLTAPPELDFVEIISENFMVRGGRPLATLDALRERYAMVMHGVSMSIGSADGVSLDYLRRLKALADRVRPAWISDHLCWTGAHGQNLHDLLPLPYTDEALDVVCANIAVAQDILERPLVIENPSSYLTFASSTMTEWAFLSRMCERTGCALLLDVNNIHVSGVNHGFDPYEFLAGVPADRVWQIHLAGHTDDGELLIDTHDEPVPDPVWRLYEAACRRFGPVATMIERDDRIPPLEDLIAELDIARTIAADVACGLAA
ncbi:MAG: MNIO family bufferin maturase [Brevundimonas sp.]|jgi:uncharacterized protein (UPF0276 family)|uniref:MNIO family bufferin maturase n=1 Tax=Brevundimonas sp. TaxID=1871086 RepID=UPI004034EFBC